MTDGIALEFKDYPSIETPQNADNLNEMQTSLLDLVYPIGRGFIDFTNTDYSNYLGFTWEKELVGMTPVGLDTTQTEFDTLGKTGGEKTNTLVLANIPPGKNINVDDAIVGVSYGAPTTGGIGYSVTLGNTSALMRTSGSNATPHNNLQPYKVVNFWKRVE